ncbi:Uma2 family endonuclease [Rudanella paleaurantiibacter]|uniref:Uma2 family endonuclease n=1 Tax=Rudanella paleaurantiibacter TaxID=2614655 RepID=A0A7J5U4P3_9BACT|nr:Uma2 family endonuclease [Rudanella paleaurantiibacter]
MVNATLSLSGQIVERLQTEEEVLVPVSLDEYWEVASEIGEEHSPMEYDIEYLDGHLRARIKMATDFHELIVANLAGTLRSIYYDYPDVRVMGSNRTVYVEPCQMAVKPDLVVMNAPSDLYPRKGQEAGIKNPYMLVEVFSDSTQKQDRNLKLRCYKQLPSVQYIIYVEQYLPYVSVYTKNGDVHHWLNDDYDTLDAVIKLGDAELSLRDIYHKVSF